MFEISQNCPLIRGVIKELFQTCLKPEILHLSSFQGCKVTASQVEDLGLHAILEKMNSLMTPLISGPFSVTLNFFQKF